MNFQEHCKTVVSTLSDIKIVPVLVLEEVKSGLKMCEILADNGLPAAEITFRTPAAAEIIREAAKNFPGLYLGARTILNTRDLDRAFDAGARFAVAPGFNPTVVKAAVSSGRPFAPGVCTPGEVEQAMELGCRFLKFFPAEAAGGVKMLQAVIAPYRHLGIRFMPTGGVTAANAANYLAIKEVAAVGGTWLGKAADIRDGRFDAIAQAVREAVSLKNNL